MAARPMARAAISFGLVTVPVRVYPAVRPSAGLSFHLIHAKDQSRVKQQYVCIKEGDVVSRSEIVKGYPIAKDRYVALSNEELKALDQEATQGIEITEFVPNGAVDALFFETSYYLGPDKRGEKAYALLTEALERTELLAVARYAARGKDYLVLLRPSSDRLVMHQLYHSDEIRPAGEVPVETRTVSEAELKLAQKLIEQIARDRFDPTRYEDEVRNRIKDLIARKARGEKIEAATEPRRKAEVVDLMAALKASLGQRRPAVRRRVPAGRAVARRAASGSRRL